MNDGTGVFFDFPIVNTPLILCYSLLLVVVEYIFGCLSLLYTNNRIV